MNKGKHLDLDARMEIARGLSKGHSFKEIGLAIGKDCTTVSKEVRKHSIVVRNGAGGRRAFNDCVNRDFCCHRSDICHPCTKKSGSLCRVCGECIHQCGYYQKETCRIVTKPPYVCNVCDKRRKCALEKRIYDPYRADKEYRREKHESRSGFNLTEEERVQLDQVISPLLRQGQSLHHIMANNKDRISCCERTAYIYADAGLFEARNIDMPRKVRFRPRKKKSVEPKVDKGCRVGRTYQDFLKFREKHPAIPVVELDSVEGKKGGAVLLTIHFVRQSFQLAYRRDRNDSRSVTEIFNGLYALLGPDTYRKLFSLLLCDNGTEFSDPAALEFGPDGERRSFRIKRAKPDGKSYAGDIAKRYGLTYEEIQKRIQK